MTHMKETIHFIFKYDSKVNIAHFAVECKVQGIDAFLFDLIFFIILFQLIKNRLQNSLTM